MITISNCLYIAVTTDFDYNNSALSQRTITKIAYAEFNSGRVALNSPHKFGYISALWPVAVDESFRGRVSRSLPFPTARIRARTGRRHGS